MGSGAKRACDVQPAARERRAWSLAPRWFRSRSPAFRHALAVAAGTRALVWSAAVLSAVVLGAKSSVNASANDVPYLTAPAGEVGRVVLTPLAHWDSVWYLSIVEHGYASIAGVGAARAAFFPLYPLLVWVGSAFAASLTLQLVAAFAVSLVAFVGSLYLLHRLVALECGADYAVPTLVLLAVFPGALFFGIPYAESIFLLVTVGAFYAARTERWSWAGVLAAAASATRSAGVLIVLPLAVIYLCGPRGGRAGHVPASGRLRARFPVRANLLWLGLAPLGLVAYSAYLGTAHGDAFAWMHVQAAWARHFAGPFGGLVDGARAAWHGVQTLAAGGSGKVHLQRGELGQTRAAVVDVALFAFAIWAIAATVGVFRRLPLAYGIWVIAALFLPLSFPAQGEPLESLPRFLAVLFPLFIWLAIWARERRVTDVVAICSGVLLGVFAAQYAAWEFVA